MAVTVGKLVSLSKKLIFVRSMEEIKQLNRDLSSEVDDDYIYGMKKTVIAVTDKNIVIGIDSKSGQFFWM